VPLLHYDAVACLPAPQTGHCHFAGRRAATSTSSPALCAPRVTRTPAGCPAACHATRHQLVPRTIKPILGLRAVQLAHRFDILPSHFSQPTRFCAVASLYLFRKAFISVENLCHPMYDNASVRLLMYEWHWAHILLDRSWLITCTASLVRVCESSFFVVFLEMACAPKSAKSHGRHTPLSVDSNHEVWGLGAPPAPDRFSDPPLLSPSVKDGRQRQGIQYGNIRPVKATEPIKKGTKSRYIG
jgi:hypothetical protein